MKKREDIIFGHNIYIVGVRVIGMGQRPVHPAKASDQGPKCDPLLRPRIKQTTKVLQRKSLKTAAKLRIHRLA